MMQVVTGLASTVLIKGSVVLLVALLLARLTTRTAANASLAITVGFATLVFLPLLSMIAPDWSVGSLTISHGATGRLPGLPLSPLTLLLAVWAIGAVVMLVRLLVDLRAAIKLAARASAVDIPHALHSLRLAANTIGSKVPMLRETSELATVAVIGVRRPVLLVPLGARTWSDEELYGVFCHELEHLRRRDWLSSIAERIVAAMYWVNPLTHVMIRFAHSAREHAADDAAMRGGAGAQAYANRLIMVARAVNAPPRFAGSVAFVSGRVDGRVRALFEARRDRRGLNAVSVSRTVVFALPLILALAAVQPWTCLPANDQAATTRCP